MFNFIERSLVFPAPSVERGDWNPRWIDKEDVFFESIDGVRLHGWFSPYPRARNVVLYAHANNEHVGDQVNVVLRLQATLEATVFVFDYRGYGRSQGSPTEAGCIADGLAAQQWLAERTGLLPEDLIIAGRSLGGGVAVAVAAERGARALVLENTFSRLTDAAGRRYPFLPVRLLMSNQFDSLTRIRGYDGPLFQLHGAADSVAPLSDARRLFAAAPSQQKQFFEAPNGRHMEPPPREYYEALSAFLEYTDVRNRRQLAHPLFAHVHSDATPQVAS